MDPIYAQIDHWADDLENDDTVIVVDSLRNGEVCIDVLKNPSDDFMKFDDELGSWYIDSHGKLI